MTWSIDSRKLSASLVAACLAVGWSGAALAQAPQPWTIQGKLTGKPKNLEGSESKNSKDVSGIACATESGFPRLCLIADDETQGAQIIILQDGKLIAGDFVRLIDDSFVGKPLELDAEGVAFAGGAFYVIGSHGRPRHESGVDAAAEVEARVMASSEIFRIRFAPDSIDMTTGKLMAEPEKRRSTELPAIVRAQPELAPFAQSPLEENGLTIEGVAVRDGALLAGLRGPVLEGNRAVILSVPLGMLFDHGPGGATLLKLELGVDGEGHARGVRDLLAYQGKLLVLAGPVNDPPEGQPIKLGDYSVFSDGDQADKLLDLEGYGAEIKPEALLPLGEADGRLRVLLLFDGPAGGQPTPVEFGLK
ncbi:DUF3616 domain-containing protein [Mesorhizobium sp. M0292]|uniref:DUF3616 domain-containing protein n=1 Tax=Mesorhizobium sp. M0292 TaxID=2956929 RepID=UPI003337CD79